MSALRGRRSESRQSSVNSDQAASASANSATTKPTAATTPAAAASIASNGQSNDSEASGRSKLVFGLSSRTNRLKHDEYAEKRSGGQQQSSQVSQVGLASGSNKSLVNKTNMNENGSAQDNKAAALTSRSSSPVAATAAVAAAAATTTLSGNGLSQQVSTIKSPKNESKPRASKYGNFYKPQDLVTPAAPATTTTPKTTDKGEHQGGKRPKASSAASKELRAKLPARSNGVATTPVKKKSGTGTSQVAEMSPTLSSNSARTTTTTNTSTTITMPTKTTIKRSVSPSSRESSATRNEKVNNNSVGAPPNSGLVSGEDKPKMPAGTLTGKPALKSQAPATASSTTPSLSPTPVQQQQQPSKARMQFNIPPPPKIYSSTTKTNTDSVVSYAKSRIYDKPMRKLLLNSEIIGQSLLHDSGAIPQSILSGIKPPKQVNVSKAREKWEGGEPFAKCKSRQRLAQASKKLLHGAWSMTSVVATQQLQLQQALANSNIRSSSTLESDPSVKILTRGSVLERVQQYEKAPGSAGSFSGSSSVSGDDDDDSYYNYMSFGSFGGNCSSTGGASLVASGGDQPGEACLTMGHGAIKSTSGGNNSSADAAVTSQPTSKQAIYKSRVSSIQSAGSQPQEHKLLSITTLRGEVKTIGGAGVQINKQSASLISNQAAPVVAGRRLSFRRRSSSASNSIIPKFYHPNGKPNTYEIELQKKNIVACFDKFPDRKALLSGPNCRRHFHAISLACGFTEYFKEPLVRYVKHQLASSSLLHNAVGGAGGGNSNSTPGRKQSNAGQTNGIRRPSIIFANSPSSNGIQQQQQQQQQQQKQTLRPLVRAASIDTSTMEKLQNQNYVTCEQFLICWRNIISSSFDLPARFVHLLTLGQRNYLVPNDFVPLIQSIIEDHHGLKFLRAAPDFHMRYIQTVIARIYFCINKSWTGKISSSELRHSNLLAVLQVLSQEEDINQITDYFSYEHFYVIYCKFWSLDQDHDLLISKEDLARHNDAAISSRIIERIFMGIVSKQIQQTGKMSYSDFVWFLIAEEDKKHPRSVEYWFRLMDIDGDGYISMYEMEYFYYEQMKRLELMNIEALPFLDSACQILDLVNPREKNKISLSDLKRTKMATIFFDTFINLEKYLEHESREFVSTRDVVQDGVVISDWDRYASEEYESLVTEESAV